MPIGKDSLNRAATAAGKSKSTKPVAKTQVKKPIEDEKKAVAAKKTTTEVKAAVTKTAEKKTVDKKTADKKAVDKKAAVKKTTVKKATVKNSRLTPLKEVMDMIQYEESFQVLQRDAGVNETFGIGDAMPIYYY